MKFKKIINPHEGAPSDNSTLVSARLSPRVYNYLFKQALIGRGVKQGLICSFFEALYAECLAQRIPATWDETNETKIANIVERTNFDADSIRSLLAQFPKGFTVHPDGSVIGLADGPERADRPAPQHQAQPKAKGRKSGGVKHVDQQDQATQQQQPNADGTVAD